MIVYDTLKGLEVGQKPILTLFNKQDLVTKPELLHDSHADRTLKISAKKREGLEEVKQALSQMLRENKIYLERLIPYTQAGLLARIRSGGELVSEEYRPEGIFVKAYVPKALYPIVAFGETD